MQVPKLTDNPAIGVTTEFVAGQPRATPCYGTFAGDLGDPAFRFRISYVEHSGDFPLHSHEYAELVVVLAGTALHRTDAEDHPLEAGDVFVISSDRSHGFGRAQNLRLCNIMFDPLQFLSRETELAALMGYHALFRLAPQSTEPRSFTERMHLSGEALAHVNSILAALAAEFERRSEGWTVAIRYHFLSLAAFLSRAYTQQTREHVTPLLQMARVASHIQQHYSGTIGVDDLARIAHLSSSQFQRRFKQHFQQTPVQFITQVRLKAACELLKDPNYDITQIALRSGFSSSAFFSAQFRRHLGESPSQYRKRAMVHPAP